ncbi:hypothetical protein PPROV_000563300 [Pycnococcus provasolii]|uniref:EF-hand domain-containing protein n=1 Tax=Pycnococcus provasolii TaxID=41880 RepID=A0A830HP95_9CHLO|nr:hypothetical protein PPROV_000563300 [Pycnococcus provasolii]
MMSAREKIDKNILGEIKSLGNPPETVKETVLVLVAVVTGVKKSDEWINGVKAISDPGFVKLIQEHDGTVPSKAAPALKKYVATYKVEDVKSKSAAFIAEWLHELAGSGAAGPTKDTNPREWAVFEQIDLNGNGSLDMDEVKVALEKLGEEATADKLLPQLDLNGDGVITFDEFVTGFAKSGLGKVTAESG